MAGEHHVPWFVQAAPTATSGGAASGSAEEPDRRYDGLVCRDEA